MPENWILLPWFMCLLILLSKLDCSHLQIQAGVFLNTLPAVTSRECLARGTCWSWVKSRQVGSLHIPCCIYDFPWRRQVRLGDLGPINSCSASLAPAPSLSLIYNLCTGREKGGSKTIDKCILLPWSVRGYNRKGFICNPWSMPTC